MFSGGSKKEHLELKIYKEAATAAALKKDVFKNLAKLTRKHLC